MKKEEILLKIAQLEREILQLKQQLPNIQTVAVPSEMNTIFTEAEEVVGDYFSKLCLNPENGTIQIEDERYVLIRASSLSNEFFQNFEQNFPDKSKEEIYSIAKDFLFDLGHVIGLEDAKRFHKKMKLDNPISKLSAGPIHFAYAGWAFVEILPESNPQPNENFYLKYNHPYSFEADSWIKAGQKSDTAVCIMNAAYSSGWCEASFRMPLTAVEITCRGKGDSHCTFIMAPPHKIESYVNQELKHKKSQKPNIPIFFERKTLEEKLKSSQKLIHEAQFMAKIGVWELNLENQDLFWSDELIDMYEFNQIDKKLIYEQYLKSLKNTDKNTILTCFEEARILGKDFKYEHPIHLKNGKIKWVSCSGVPIKDEHGIVIKIKGFSQDITDRINSERELQNLFNLSIDLHCIVDFKGFFQKLSPQWSKKLGYSKEILYSNSFMYFVHPDDIKNTEKETSKLLRGKITTDFENRYRCADGSYIHLSWNVFPDKVTGLLYATARDITNQKKNEEKLKKNEQMLNSAQKIAHLGSWEFDVQKNKVVWSDQMYQIFEINKTQEKNLIESFNSRLDEDELKALDFLFENCLKNGKPYSMEYTIYLKNDRSKILYTHGIPQLNEKREVVKIYGITQDITESKKQNKILVENIREKEVLLKEVHHRVKNNLQIISSLLNLQSRMLENEELQLLYQESQNRIKSIAAVHELLYQSDELSEIPFSSYLNKLGNDLINSYHGENCKIKLFINTKEKFNIDTSIPLGLLVNEIISNSLKHGLKNEANEFIYIDIFKLKYNKYQLKIGDNGCGFANFETTDFPQSLGIMLIKDLSEQLNGEIIKTDSDKGTHYELIFTSN